MSRSDYCAIDFGTSNSAIALAAADVGARSSRLVELEPGQSTMPTAVFYFADGPAHAPPHCEFGRAAVAAYVDGIDGRLLRSMKSILGSTLADQATDVGGGRSVGYLDVVATYLSHLRRRGESARGGTLRRAVVGRPVYFVDDDPARDRAAQAALEHAARRAGFAEIAFEYEPIAAAFDYERQARREEIVLVADIGGGTSDFSLVRVGPDRAGRVDRGGDILAHHGVHVAGTDFDRRVELAAVMPLLGYRSLGPGRAGEAAREVPSGVYFDLATWHLINTVYSPQRVAELRSMRGFYAEPRLHARLMTVVEERLGHDLVARAESAKIAVAAGGSTAIDLARVEPGLAAALDANAAERAIDADLERIVAAARRTVADAGLREGDVDALYFTGGSTGLDRLTARLAATFAGARAVRGDRYASVVAGLALAADRRWGSAA